MEPDKYQSQHEMGQLTQLVQEKKENGEGEKQT